MLLSYKKYLNRIIFKNLLLNYKFCYILIFSNKLKQIIPLLQELQKKKDINCYLVNNFNNFIRFLGYSIFIHFNNLADVQLVFTFKQVFLNVIIYKLFILNIDNCKKLNQKFLFFMNNYCLLIIKY
jgi:hypothetical protein